MLWYMTLSLLNISWKVYFTLKPFSFESYSLFQIWFVIKLFRQKQHAIAILSIQCFNGLKTKAGENLHCPNPMQFLLYAMDALIWIFRYGKSLKQAEPASMGLINVKNIGLFQPWLNLPV